MWEMMLFKIEKEVLIGEKFTLSVHFTTFYIYTLHFQFIFKATVTPPGDTISCLAI